MPLFRDRWVAVVRAGHPLASAPPSARDFAAAGHVVVLRKGLHGEEIDEAARLPPEAPALSLHRRPRASGVPPSQRQKSGVTAKQSLARTVPTLLTLDPDYPVPG
jgi:DNA-binding transcriptional LysR family regulator